MSSLRGEIDHYHEKKEAVTDLRSVLGSTDTMFLIVLITALSRSI